MGRCATEVICPEDLQLPGSPLQSLDKRLKDAGSACKVKSIALQELLSSQTTNDVFSENGRERVGS